MEIIRPGSTERKDGVYTFACKNCGCVFKANHDEYKYDYSQREGSSWYEIKCPFCGKHVTLDTEDARRQESMERIKAGEGLNPLSRYNGHGTGWE